jgi:hypothetical protein
LWKTDHEAIENSLRIKPAQRQNKITAKNTIKNLSMRILKIEIFINRFLLEQTMYQKIKQMSDMSCYIKTNSYHGELVSKFYYTINSRGNGLRMNGEKGFLHPMASSKLGFPQLCLSCIRLYSVELTCIVVC